MVKSTKSHLDEEDEAEDYDSSSYKEEAAKAESKSNELKANANRSKHSETEQRRRSKINERFQALRNLVPQNDQKRDKASFLLEVIEYVQFLQDKLQIYEGSYEGWSQEPAKLLPWKNYSASAESRLGHTQVMKSGSAHENTVMLGNVHNSIKSDIDTAAMYKTLDHSPGPTNPAIPFDVQTQSCVFAAVGRGGVSTESLQESVSDAENMAYQLQSQLLQPCATECITPNNTLNGQEDMASDSRSVNISNAYSKQILNTLTQALQSSGVDLAQTSITVQIDVGKRENGTNAVAPSSKDQVNHYLSNQLIIQDGVGSSVEDLNQAHKRQKREKC
ncbi:PREDICTED: transcription factor BIM2-like isoform X2 [Populus euphratica]|uniref:Transcription factor BIM2-like isoform X2 n=1 Tax=Populus euphratica TaxID=75702 RepID=A0AAJ6U1J5_POPEU|nr:PREDICTED: transcription factor BIM2-like isoform X2 [Populus euphratica]